MARFQLAGEGWKIGNWKIPGGVTIDTGADWDRLDAWSLVVKARRLQPPLNATPLDRPTYELMIDLYGHRHVMPLKAEAAEL
jgi:hypothetical protein